MPGGHQGTAGGISADQGAYCPPFPDPQGVVDSGEAAWGQSKNTKGNSRSLTVLGGREHSVLAAGPCTEEGRGRQGQEAVPGHEPQLSLEATPCVGPRGGSTRLPRHVWMEGSEGRGSKSSRLEPMPGAVGRTRGRYRGAGPGRREARI